MSEKQQDRVSIEFSNKQIFNRRTITNKDGNVVDLVSISLPSASQYKGYSITANANYVYQSKFNPNMSYMYLLAGKDMTIKKYDKETGVSEEKKLSVDELRKEFRSWQKDKAKSKNASNADKITDNKTKYQSAPEDTYDDTMGVPEQDYEPIDI